MNGLQIKQKMFIGILVPLIMLLMIGFIAVNMMGKLRLVSNVSTTTEWFHLMT